MTAQIVKRKDEATLVLKGEYNESDKIVEIIKLWLESSDGKAYCNGVECTQYFKNRED